MCTALAQVRLCLMSSGITGMGHPHLAIFTIYCGVCGAHRCVPLCAHAHSQAVDIGHLPLSLCTVSFFTYVNRILPIRAWVHHVYVIPAGVYSRARIPLGLEGDSHELPCRCWASGRAASALKGQATSHLIFGDRISHLARWEALSTLLSAFTLLEVLDPNSGLCVCATDTH